VLRLGPPAVAQALPAEGARLSVPGEALLGQLRVAAGTGALPAAEAAVEVDAEAVRGGLCVRRWRPGDRIQPLGMTGTKKLQDLFVDAHVPREQRAAVPVLECERGIVWVGGLRVAEWARAREGRPVVVLSYEAR